MAKHRSKRRKGKMPAGLARYWAARGRGSKRRRASKRDVVVFSPNPPRRRRHRTVHHRVHRRRVYRSNPPGFMADVMYTAGGFLGTKVVAGFALPMIGMAGNPLLRIAGKGAVAYGLAFIAQTMLGRSAFVPVLTGGALEVVNDVIKTYVAPMVPALAAAEIEESHPSVSAYYQMNGQEVAEYLQPAMAGDESDNVAV